MYISKDLKNDFVEESYEYDNQFLMDNNHIASLKQKFDGSRF